MLVSHLTYVVRSFLTLIGICVRMCVCVCLYAGRGWCLFVCVCVCRCACACVRACVRLMLFKNICISRLHFSLNIHQMAECIYYVHSVHTQTAGGYDKSTWLISDSFVSEKLKDTMEKCHWVLPIIISIIIANPLGAVTLPGNCRCNVLIQSQA